MGKLAQTVLPFKLESTSEHLTAQAGLALFGEFLQGLGFSRWLSQAMLRPGSGRGYPATAYVVPLTLMLTGGGRSLEDLRMLAHDKALAHVLGHRLLPSADAFGDWLRRMGNGFGLAGLRRINERLVATRPRQMDCTGHTLDGDASQIVAEKHAAQFTYKGEQGYMPMIGHLAEGGIVVHDAFRGGNVAPAPCAGECSMSPAKSCATRAPGSSRSRRDHWMRFAPSEPEARPWRRPARPYSHHRNLPPPSPTAFIAPTARHARKQLISSPSCPKQGDWL